jgi:hypothetical protein|tara:strand:- start:310 stop:540 length:231 start_codon:yes stop_codon:yes gene_type:complete
MSDSTYKIGDLVELSGVITALAFDKFKLCIHGIVIGYGQSRKYSNYKVFWWPLNEVYYHKDGDLILLSRVWYNHED